ncbi:hypothetical protein MBLNU230_g4572t1 [Neophaeotheca triangularis]
MDVADGKPGPNVGTLVKGIRVLIAYGIFKWGLAKGFKMTEHDSGRLRVWVDQVTRAGRLTRGTWRKRTWIGFAVLSRLVRTYLDRGIAKGQLLLTIKEMALAAGMLNRAYGHALRLGATRDVAHLPARLSDGTGLATDNVRQSISHKQASRMSGATERYAGGSSFELYNARATTLAKEPRGREVQFTSTASGQTGPEARGITSKLLA